MVCTFILRIYFLSCRKNKRLRLMKAVVIASSGVGQFLVDHIQHRCQFLNIITIKTNEQSKRNRLREKIFTSSCTWSGRDTIVGENINKGLNSFLHYWKRNTLVNNFWQIKSVSTFVLFMSVYPGILSWDSKESH